MRSGLIVTGLWAAGWAANAAPAPVIDNDEVTVTDLALAQGQSGPATPKDEDTVVMFLEGGRIRTVTADGKSHTVVRRFGDAVFVPKGAQAVDTVVGGGPAHEIVVALKNRAMPRVANTSGLPMAFPRPGSVKRLENRRVVVWRYTWGPDIPTPVHFHDKDVVVAYRYDGTLASTTPDGKVTNNAYKAGEIHFNKAGRIHSERLTTARQSAVMMELK